MTAYQNRGRDSGVTEFEATENSITVYFSNGSCYLYNVTAPGLQAVQEMIRLANMGEGLNTYINRHIRSNFARRIR
ncbi:hypothetical protein [Kluyvera intermedia]|uniref:hypothetical protein n=1 Tax=Kluyvera intermedia TaxID=61648 RepID=UPI00372D675F